MFFKIGILKSFAIFTGKYLCWGLFLKVAGLFYRTLWVAASAVLKNLKISQENISGGGFIDLSF